jgi:hypothetical protein
MTFGLRHDQADVFGSGWQKLVLGAALCLPVPTFAMSGLAVPLPAAIYRAAAGIVEQTQAFTQAFTPFAGGRVETTRLLAPPTEGRDRSFAGSPSRSSGPSRTATRGRTTGVAGAAQTTAPRALPTRKNRQATAPSSERSAVQYTFASEPPQAARAEAPETLVFSAEPAPTTQPQEHRFTTRPAPGQPSLTRTEHPARPEQPAKDETPTRSEQPERNDSSPRQDPPPGERRTSPPAVLSPPPPLPTEDRPNLPPAPPIPEMNSARAMLRALVKDNPGTPLASKLEDAMDKLGKADIELAKTPPDRRAALNNIEDATGDVEAAVEHGLLAAARGNTIMALLAEEARSFAQTAIGEAIARAGDLFKIVDAERRLAEGDVHRTASAYKQAVGKYRDALSKAEGA